MKEYFKCVLAVFVTLLIAVIFISGLTFLFYGMVKIIGFLLAILVLIILFSLMIAGAMVVGD